MATLTVPEFTVNPSSCVVTYVCDITDQPPIINPLSGGRGVMVQSNDAAYSGNLYFITVTAMVECGPMLSLTYKLTMGGSTTTCNDEVLSIDPTHAVFQVPPAVTKTYTIGAASETIDWSDTDVTS